MELVLNGVQKSFGEKHVLRGASFRFEKGKIYGLLGRNGAGKTTLFNCLSDEILPDAGEALLKTDEGTRPLRADDVGYVFTMPVLPDFLTGYEFVRFFMDINRGRIDASKTIDEYFDMVQLEHDDRYRLLKDYSHGMKNKIQMLSFLIARPPVILLDEPLTSFDVVVALEMKELIKKLKNEHILIFSTHILQLATDLCDEIVILSDGKLSHVPPTMLKSPDFEAEILARLKDGPAYA